VDFTAVTFPIAKWYQRPTRRGSQVVRAEGDELSVTRDHMNATILQAFQVDIPDILKRHSRYGETM
jgi:hypothetical protein